MASSPTRPRREKRKRIVVLPGEYTSSDEEEGPSYSSPTMRRTTGKGAGGVGNRGSKIVVLSAPTKPVDLPMHHHGKAGPAAAEIVAKWLVDRVQGLKQTCTPSSSWLEFSPRGKVARSNTIVQQESLDILGRLVDAKILVRNDQVISVLISHLQDKREVLAQQAARSLMLMNDRPQLFTDHQLATIFSKRIGDYRPEWRMFALEMISGMPSRITKAYRQVACEGRKEVRNAD